VATVGVVAVNGVVAVSGVEAGGVEAGGVEAAFYGSEIYKDVKTPARNSSRLGIIQLNGLFHGFSSCSKSHVNNIAVEELN
jgi:hypothetical protein